ncbi:MAG: hypothetical protein FJ308_02855 [Planctomycetes bacterium]|nr:hypothetical protein [Planctomycetota bacterium]
MAPTGRRIFPNASRPILGWVFVGCFLLLGAWGGVDAYAGCGAHGGSSASRLDAGQTKGGELGFPMYREYVGGRWSYSHVIPQVPCDGPGCRAKPSCRPVGVAVVSSETITATCFSQGCGFGSLIPPNPDRVNVPASEFALRGQITPPEPPPKF